MIKLAVPDIGEEELEEVKRVFDSKYLVQGKNVEEFEQLVKDYLSVKHVIAVSSGTAALHLALLALDIKHGDEVIVPDFTFPATANVVEIVGAQTRFVDIDLDSLCIDVNKIEKEITSRTKAIIPVHEFGQPCNMDKIMDLSNKYGLKVVEDAACAFGAEYKGIKVGTIGDVGCFSLHPRKAITTGEGGIIVTNNDTIASQLRVLRNHGIDIINGKPQFVSVGLNYRITNIQGAIGVVQMKKLNKIYQTRINLVCRYNELLKDTDGIILPTEFNYGKHIWQTYHICLDKRFNRDLLMKKLMENGIETNYGAYAVHEQPYYKKRYNFDDNNFNNAIYANRFGLALPLHNELKDEDIWFIVSKLKAIIERM